MKRNAKARNKSAQARHKSASPRRASQNGKVAVVPAVLQGKSAEAPGIHTAKIPVALEINHGRDKGIASATAEIPVAVNARKGAKGSKRRKGRSNLTVLPVAVSGSRKRRHAARRKQAHGARAESPPAAQPANLVVKAIDAEEKAVNTLGRYTIAAIDTLDDIFRVVLRKTAEAGQVATQRVAAVPDRARRVPVPSTKYSERRAA